MRTENLLESNAIFPWSKCWSSCIFQNNLITWFKQIGEVLKDKFDSATEVEPRMSHSGSRRSLIPRSPTYKPHTDTDLVYLDRSPDYCELDSKIGSLGTHNRLCNKVRRFVPYNLIEW